MRGKSEKFVVVAVWDDEAGVYYSKSNIHGLHIEAETLKEFEEILDDCAADLILSNHFTPEELNGMALRDIASRLAIKLVAETNTPDHAAGFPGVDAVATA